MQGQLVSSINLAAPAMRCTSELICIACQTFIGVFMPQLLAFIASLHGAGLILCWQQYSTGSCTMCALTR